MLIELNPVLLSMVSFISQSTQNQRINLTKSNQFLNICLLFILQVHSSLYLQKFKLNFPQILEIFKFTNPGGGPLTLRPEYESLSVYGMLRQDNKKPNQMVIHMSVNSICYSLDGTTLASGSADNSIRLWDVETGQQKAKLDGHSDCVRTICYSPDGTTLASGSLGNSIRLWDVKTGQQNAKLDGHPSTVYSVDFSPDGNTLVSGSYDNSIRLWNVQTSKEILQSNNSYKDLLAQFNIPLQNSSLLPNVNPYCTILKICQIPLLEASGTLILQGQFINHQGKDLKPLFKSKGSCFLEDLKQK
ncbi:unnamed protein product [Paramecium octaurelia]|uniref:Uncharacterized protein n=1 Tax=Paramecium octaurelia TaxID=43137 RepID=A0A8S1YPK5_PAROT|nr:unnamed protein product [Paramecium octaurelia]